MHALLVHTQTTKRTGWVKRGVNGPESIAGGAQHVSSHCLNQGRVFRSSLGMQEIDSRLDIWPVWPVHPCPVTHTGPSPSRGPLGAN